MRLVSMLPITKKSPIKLYSKKNIDIIAKPMKRYITNFGEIKQQIIANNNKYIDDIIRYRNKRVTTATCRDEMILIPSGGTIQSHIQLSKSDPEGFARCETRSQNRAEKSDMISVIQLGAFIILITNSLNNFFSREI